MQPTAPTRVLIVDRAPAFRRKLTAALARHAHVQVVADARDSRDAREAIIRHHPDVIVVGLERQNDDALDLIRRLRENYPVPVLACGAGRSRSDSDGVRAVENGALEVLLKPADTPEAWFGFGAQLAQRIAAVAAQARPVPRERAHLPQPKPSFNEAGLDPRRYVVVVGASTGGPQALHALLKQVPHDFPPIVIVQHMPAMFTQAFATRLDGACAIHISEAANGEPCLPGRALIARGDTHLELARARSGWTVRYTHQNKVNNHCPSVDVLFNSAVEAAGNRAIGVLMTGMGADGARGLLRLREAGALTIAQDDRSSVVYGMPKAAQELGAVEYAGRPEDMPLLMVQGLSARRAASATR